MSDRLLTASEVAEYLGLSTATVLDRWEAGDLPGFRLFGRKGGPVRFRLSEVEAVLEDWRRGPTIMEVSDRASTQPRPSGKQVRVPSAREGCDG